MVWVPFPLAGKTCSRCNSRLGHNSMRCDTCADALDSLKIGQWFSLDDMKTQNEHVFQKDHSS